MMIIIIIIAIMIVININQLSLCWFCLQEDIEASYVATMKTIRQVKTVFIIFIAFVCCWSPYIVVLLYDSSDSLPLSIHLYASMLAHLHASLNFAIYSLNSCNLGENCRHFAEHLVACCRHPTTPSNVVAAVVCSSRCTRMNGRRTGIISGIDVNRTSLSLECYQLQEVHGWCGSKTFNVGRPTVFRLHYWAPWSFIGNNYVYLRASAFGTPL